MRRTLCSASVLPVLIAALTCCTCAKDSAVALRRFPYPYRAALAISSDVDETDSIGKLLEIQRFLCTSEETSLGRGLGLEIGNSFWFYNQYLQLLRDGKADPESIRAQFSGTPDLGISIFDGVSAAVSPDAPVILNLIRSGYLDCLHSYGHFTRGGFRRPLAAQALGLLERESLAVDVFVNHGGRENENNLGILPWCLGDDSASVAYHSDLTLRAGIKFLWRGQLTHCIGQSGDLTLTNLVKQAVESVLNLRHPEQVYPHDNRLVHVYRLDDGRSVLEFVRYINPWGKDPTARQEFIPRQLGSRQIDELIATKGYLIFYTHLGAGREPPYLSAPTRESLRYIKSRHDAGDLLVTTTSKLLRYHVRHERLRWRFLERRDSVLVMIDGVDDPIDGRITPDAADLEGITFYVPEGLPVSLTATGRPVPFVVNGKDWTGRASISVPWHVLRFPTDPWIRVPTPQREDPAPPTRG